MASYDSVPVCEGCWRKRVLEAPREPVRFKEPLEEKCFYCDAPTRSGIYVRERVE